MRPLTPLLILGSLLPALATRAQTAEPVPMADGVELATDVYLSTLAAPPFPTLLLRTPYDKSAMASAGTNLTNALPMAVVVQDLRGRFASAGVDCVFRCDLGDGADTVAWIRQQPWSNGDVATFGGSAMGIVQYDLAAANPPGLVSMSVSVATPSFYEHALFPGGVFRQSMIEGWLGGQGSTFFLQDIAAHPLLDSFWAPVQVADRFAEVNAPTLHWGGWFDIFAQGTLDAFVGYQSAGGAGARGKQHLVMGPWVHGGLPPDRKQGELTYPTDALAPPSGAESLLRFSLHHLGLLPDRTFIDSLPTVQYYVMGALGETGAPGNVWRSTNAWPVPAAPVRFHLQPGGRLAEHCPPADTPPTAWLYDPGDPSPTVGGANLLLPAGSFDQRGVEARPDVLIFETPDLELPLEITGRLGAHLWISTDAPDTDLVVRLSDHYPDGRSMLLLDAPARLAHRKGLDHLEPYTPGEVVEVTIDLWSTSIILATGHRLRASVSASNAPRFFPNPNDGSTYGEASTARAATIELFHDATHPSYLELPLPDRSPDAWILCARPTPNPPGPPDEKPGCSCESGAFGSSHSSPFALSTLLFLLASRTRRRARV